MDNVRKPRKTVASDTRSRGAYGRRQGQAPAIRLVISSTAPFVLAFMMENIGGSWSLTVAAIVGAVAVLAFIAIDRLAYSLGQSHRPLGRVGA